MNDNIDEQIKIVPPIQWKGIVSCHRVNGEDKVKVVSSRIYELSARAISCEVDYMQVAPLFKDCDDEVVCAYAEYGGGHLQFFEKVPNEMFFKHKEQFLS